MAKPVDQVWHIEGLDIHVRIYQEWRKNNRISITKDKVIIRVPKLGARVFNTTYEEWAKSWLTKQFRTHDDLRQRFSPFSYTTGHVVKTAYSAYTLEIVKEDRKTSTAKLSANNTMRIKLNDSISAKEEEKTIRTLIARLIGQHTQPLVANRIHELNKIYFGEVIKGVRIKNNRSNWGSCSSNSNVNISVRTLFAPLDVQDYVFIHELAHLKELNHSPRYWKIVSDIMPDYKQKEKWLKLNGALCNF